jgi:hypothetical protein
MLKRFTSPATGIKNHCRYSDSDTRTEGMETLRATCGSNKVFQCPSTFLLAPSVLETYSEARFRVSFSPGLAILRMGECGTNAPW